MNPFFILGASIAVVFILIIRLKLNAFIAMIAAAVAVGLMSPRIPLGDVMNEAARAFGTVVGNIGIVIAFAALIGHCLMESGAADRVTRSFVRLLGEKRASLALLITSFVLSMPVFFDTVFYLLVPLARTMRVRTGGNYLLYVMAICAGGAVAHTMIPPTPGPLAIAATLNVDLGAMILAGVILGIPAAASGWLFSRVQDRRLHVPFRETPGVTMEELEVMAHLDEAKLPPLWLSLAPILLPVFLITAHTILGAIDPQHPALKLTGFIGNPNLALILSAAIAMITLAKQKGYTLSRLAAVLEPSLANGALIILITAGGGAYGGMLVKAGVGEVLAQKASGMAIPTILLGFLLAATIKVAQGSSTVAMITSSTIIAPMLSSNLPYHPVYVGIAISCGSLVGSWMNDSGFWVYTQMGGLTETEALKTWTPLLALLGLTGFAATAAAAWLIPLR